MLPRQLRVGDLVDDYCPRERRLTDHAIVAMVGDGVRQVRCTACDGEHEYRQGKLPVTRRKKPGLPAPPSVAVATLLPPGSPDESRDPADAGSSSPDGATLTAAASATGNAALPEADTPADDAEPAGGGAHDGPFHRPLIRAQLPRIEGGEPPQRPIPEFTMHRAAPSHGPRHGRPFRPGATGGPVRQGGGHGMARHGGGPRHGQGPGNVDGNTFGNRGGKGGHGGPGGAHGSRPSRHGFGPKPPRGPKKP